MHTHYDICGKNYLSSRKYYNKKHLRFFNLIGKVRF